MASCVSPVKVWYSKLVNPSGKRSLVFKADQGFGPGFAMDCSQCIECRANDALDKTVRIMHEAKLYDQSWFVTLTYNADTLPKDGGLSKRDAWLFVHRLRKMQWRRFKRRIRYFTTGEYGEERGRPHYHLIIFNAAFPDRKDAGKNERGDLLFSSELLDAAWQHQGICKFGAVSYDSAHYCAKYGLKRITGPKADEYYLTDDGVLVQPEYSVASRKPGIGRAWFDRYYKDFYSGDFCVLEGKEVPIPKQYDVWYEAIDPLHMRVIKLNRRRRGRLMRLGDTPQRRRSREVIALKRLALRKRDVA